MLDPTMPKRMSPEVERELRHVLGWLNRPNPIDVCDAIREALAAQEEAARPARR